ncbi:hypothetical protein Busp01_11070 [Trinickia caryophylli]|nr:hypothetical protein Busp01_11070 [Trinickia caryophylli]
MTHAAANLSNASGRFLTTQGDGMDSFLKYGNVFNHAQFSEAYQRALVPRDVGGQASGEPPPAGGQPMAPRPQPMAGELQALRDLRGGNAPKPRSPRAEQPNAAHVPAWRPAAEAKNSEAPFEERVEQEFVRWLEGGGPTARRTEAAARMEYARLESARTLKLDGLSLGRIPARIGQFAKLQTLRIGGNELDHLPSAVTRLTQLHTLDARNNRMTELPPKIGRLSSLKHLNVDANNLTSLPNELAALARLETLSARSNQLKLVPSRMSALGNLKKLDLARNQVGDIPGTWGVLFRHLEHLDLSHNRLEQLPSTCEVPARKLQLDLSENRWLSGLPTAFRGFRYASRLRLSAADDHKLESVGGTLAVNTKGTGIRQTLVNEGRLEAGRGIVVNRTVPGRNRPRLVQLEGSDWNSTISELSFIRDHAEPGGIEGLEQARQNAAFDEDWGEQRLQAWVEAMADQYAERHLVSRGGTSAPAQPESAPEPDAWTATGVDIFDRGRSGALAPPASQEPQAEPQAGPGPRTDYMAALYDELARLPPAEASAVAAYLRSIPSDRLASALEQLSGSAEQGGAAVRRH